MHLALDFCGGALAQIVTKPRLGRHLGTRDPYRLKDLILIQMLHNLLQEVNSSFERAETSRDDERARH